MAIKKCSTLISLQSNPPVAAGLQSDETPGGAFVLFLSYGCANLPDGCWSAQAHHEHPAGSTGTKLPLYPTPQHLRFRNPRELQLTAQLPISVGISWPDGCTLCAALGPTLENARQCLNGWIASSLYISITGLVFSEASRLNSASCW
ncbi:hypothetical protein T12_16900 [Trichinella patagoniensis]|uniref:Uncharacterized protein n=1 Tax=Trichinella patagoniensis TaxID=990121 RepID=A0A0V0ZPE7_9BILA|nr:hypothetical protein T12_16900 [Trichinella patagoniensis]